MDPDMIMKSISLMEVGMLKISQAEQIVWLLSVWALSIHY